MVISELMPISQIFNLTILVFKAKTRKQNEPRQLQKKCGRSDISDGCEMMYFLIFLESNCKVLLGVIIFRQCQLLIIQFRLNFLSGKQRFGDMVCESRHVQNRNVIPGTSTKLAKLETTRFFRNMVKNLAVKTFYLRFIFCGV